MTTSALRISNYA